MFLVLQGGQDRESSEAGPTRRYFGPETGMSLIELMIAVAIVGILASLAVFTFGKTTKMAKAEAEVNQMFAEFKLKQEQFAAENATYLSTGAGENDKHPPAPAGADTPNLLTPFPPSWVTLRMAPTKTQAYCSYVAIAGAAGDATNIGGMAGGFGMVVAPNENWYYLIAECDWDNDPMLNSFYFARSDVDGVAKLNVGK